LGGIFAAVEIAESVYKRREDVWRLAPPYVLEVALGHS
jgi:hypothetical protein